MLVKEGLCGFGFSAKGADGFGVQMKNVRLINYGLFCPGLLF